MITREKILPMASIKIEQERRRETFLEIVSLCCLMEKHIIDYEDNDIVYYKLKKKTMSFDFSLNEIKTLFEYINSKDVPTQIFDFLFQNKKMTSQCYIEVLSKLETHCASDNRDYSFETLLENKSIENDVLTQMFSYIRLGHSLIINSIQSFRRWCKIILDHPNCSTHLKNDVTSYAVLIE